MANNEDYWPKSVKDFNREQYAVKKDAKKRNKRKKFTKQSGYENVESDAYLNQEQHENPIERLYRISSDSCIVEVVSEFLQDLSKAINVKVNDNIVSEIESVVALFATLQGCSTYTSMMAAVILYLKNHYSTSLTSQLTNYTSEIFLQQQSDSEPDNNWMELLRVSKDNWNLCRGNKLFDQFSKLLGLFVVAGMCKVSDVSFSIANYKVFEPDMKLIHSNALDIVDAAFNTITFFIEGMYACFKTRSLRPLLMSDKEAIELDEEFAQISLYWDLVRVGNLEKVTTITESEFDRRLENLTTRIRNLLSTKAGFEKKLLSDKFTRLLGIRNDYTTKKISSGVRRAPFAIELFGESSQGKTTCGDQIVDALLKSAGLPMEKSYRASYNPSDKYMSSWTTDKIVMFIDDMANTKPNFVEKPPTQTIIDVCNNQPYYANMADLDSKGKVFVEPALVMVNTNVRDLDARHYSNCPYSIQRRMHAVITVRAKPEFQLMLDGRPQGIDSSKIYARFGDDNPAFDDIWNLTVEKAVAPAHLSESATYAPVFYRGQELLNVSFRLVLQYLIESFHQHRKNQDNVISRMESRCGNLTICGVDGCKQLQGYCDAHDVDVGPQLGEELIRSYNTATSSILSTVSRNLLGFASTCEMSTSVGLLTGAQIFCRHWDWLKFLPTYCLFNESFINIMMGLEFVVLRKYYIIFTTIMWTMNFVILHLSFIFMNRHVFYVLLSISILCGLIVQKNLVYIVKRYYRNNLLRRNTIAPILRYYRDQYAHQICRATVAVGVLYAVSRFYCRMRRNLPQGTLEPITQNDVDIRDSEETPWTQVAKRELPMSVQSFSLDQDRLQNVIDKNLVYATIIVNGRRLMGNGLFVKSNAVILPYHYFEDEVLDVTFRKVNPDKCGGKFVARLTRKSSIHIPNTDLSLCFCPSGGSFKDITSYFPMHNMPKSEFHMIWRDREGQLQHFDGLTSPCLTTNNSGCDDFIGGRYANLSRPTFGGLCGAVLMSRGKGSCVIGLHLGGIPNSNVGCYGHLSSLQLIDALQALRRLEGTLITGSAEHFEKQVLGVSILDEHGSLHGKSPLNYMPENSQIEYFGRCHGMARSKSDVKVTLISEQVMNVMGQPNIYCGPCMQPEWFGWQLCLANMANPALPFEYDLLEMAVQDYKSDLLDVFRKPLWSSCRPLTDHENLCGIPGKKFMDAIKLDTSIGYPLKGTKRPYVVELEPTPEKPNNRVLMPEIMEEIRRCEECYLRGDRAYTVAKACKKDEILSKVKCRVFFGNPIALTWLIRKYFLPILRVLQMNPLKSECAVGINSHGPEWDQLHNYVFEHGADRLIGGDYGKYDQKLPSQVLIAAIRIMIDFARECDYSLEDLSIMETMAGDIVFSLVAFNGDLIGLTEGSHISGNSLTVILNGICGSLNLRAYFYSVNKPLSFSERIPFRSVVNLMTYGDDNIGSVSKAVNNFTIRGISEFLAKYGQVYTMPDKESDLVDFLPPDEFEFLKRKTVYCPKKGIYVGALIEKSIFKMLHMYMRTKASPLTEEMASAENIDTAMREWFNHGEEVYERRREQLVQVADLCNLRHLTTQLDISYDEKIIDFKEKYIQI